MPRFIVYWRTTGDPTPKMLAVHAKTHLDEDVRWAAIEELLHRGNADPVYIAHEHNDEVHAAWAEYKRALGLRPAEGASLDERARFVTARLDRLAGLAPPPAQEAPSEPESHWPYLTLPDTPIAPPGPAGLVVLAPIAYRLGAGA